MASYCHSTHTTTHAHAHAHANAHAHPRTSIYSCKYTYMTNIIPEASWLVVAILRLRRDTAHLHEPKPHHHELPCCLCLFITPRCKPQWVAEFPPENWCMHVCMYVCMCMYVHDACEDVHVYVYLCLFVVCVRVCEQHIHVCLYTCTCACIRV